MQQYATTIPLIDLSLSLIPVLVVIGILFYWSRSHGNALYAILRMLIQLLLIGHVLMYLFQSENVYIISLMLVIMIMVSSWISMREISQKNSKTYLYLVLSILTGGGLTLALVAQYILNLQPWYYPNYLIPLASMIFSNAMNTLSLAAERFEVEINRGCDYFEARNTAYKTALIPITNSMFAVGLVSLPGMMTGQILSGISPLIAARYQIMVMCILYGSSGIAAAIYLSLSKTRAVAK
ncbi:MAG: ABC transporter permease [Gammaproteobacteria bacterium]|nr:ABC transporter permease [Gammaproteobacteria bacterium]